MARPLRLEYPGALYHGTIRGNGRSKIFRSDKDRTTFLTILAACSEPATSCWSALDHLMEDLKQFFTEHFYFLRPQSINFFQLV
jgi:hypothetical protein